MNTKFGTHHFPIGTVFTISGTGLANHDTDRQWTVAGIARNGVRSYVLRTGEFKMIAGSNHEIMYNISYVDHIVKRGTGPLVIDHNYHGMRPAKDKQVRKDLDLLEIRSPFENFVPKKGFYNTGGLNTVVLYEASKIGHESMAVDLNALTTAVGQQTWCKSVAAKGYFHVAVVNKKRLRRFIQQNINRFLFDVKKAERIDDEESSKYMEEMWASDWADHDLYQGEVSDYPAMRVGQVQDFNEYDDLD